MGVFKTLIRFEGGKAVEVGAEVGEAVLKDMVSMDEGAAYLGECALVPQHSPICESGILFYNTLFDENASCHLAMGSSMGIPSTASIWVRVSPPAPLASMDRQIRAERGDTR